MQTAPQICMSSLHRHWSPVRHSHCVSWLPPRTVSQPETHACSRAHSAARPSQVSPLLPSTWEQGPGREQGTGLQGGRRPLRAPPWVCCQPSPFTSALRMTVSSSSEPSCSKSCTVSRCECAVMFCSWDTRTEDVAARPGHRPRAWRQRQGPRCMRPCALLAVPACHPVCSSPTPTPQGLEQERARRLCHQRDWGLGVGGGTDFPQGRPHPGLGCRMGTRGRPPDCPCPPGAPTSSVQCTTSSQEKCSLGNFSRNCFSTPWGSRRWGWSSRAANTSARPPEPARTSHGVACSTALEIL